MATEINSCITTSGWQRFIMGTTPESTWSLPELFMVKIELCSLHSQAAAHMVSHTLDVGIGHQREVLYPGHQVGTLLH